MDKNSSSLNYLELEYRGRDSVLYYANSLVDLPYTIIFDSADAEYNNRFDLILAAPSRVLISPSNKTNDKVKCKTFSYDNHSASIARPSIAEAYVKDLDDWFKKGQKHYSQLEVEKCAKNLPFIGGLAGALSYDYGRRLEDIGDNLSDLLKLPDLVLGEYLCPIVIDHKKKTAQLLNYFSSKEVFSFLQKQITSDITSSASNKEFALTSAWRSNMTADEYAEKFSQVHEYILSGDCYQINLAQRFSAEYSGSAWSAYQYLRKLNKAPFSGYFNFIDGELLSLSPERFISIKDRVALTQPIKGTRPRKSDRALDKIEKIQLTNSDKDRAENLMIVDLLRNDLGKSARPGSVKVEELFGLYSFPSVHHMISSIRAELNDNLSPIDMILNAFPGGSITGAPKVRAMQIIEELESHRRHFYCGSMVYFSYHGNADSNILIRSILAKDKQLYTWAGGGLVADSEVSSEYQETFSKLSKILSPLETAG